MQETLTHYIEGCQIIEKAKIKALENQTLNILEVGFGMGLGLMATLEELKRQEVSTPIYFLSMEIDQHLVEWTLAHWQIKLERKQQDGLDFYTGHLGPHTITILIGNARIALPLFLAQNPSWRADAIYQDGFSPRKNKILWTVEWFTLLREMSHATTILSTYSASNSIRKGLLLADWKVSQGIRFGLKRASTKATLHGESAADLLDLMMRSPTEPFYDKDCRPFGPENFQQRLIFQT